MHATYLQKALYCRRKYLRPSESAVFREHLLLVHLEMAGLLRKRWLLRSPESRASSSPTLLILDSPVESLILLRVLVPHWILLRRRQRRRRRGRVADPSDALAARAREEAVDGLLQRGVDGRGRLRLRVGPHRGEELLLPVQDGRDLVLQLLLFRLDGRIDGRPDGRPRQVRRHSVPVLRLEHLGAPGAEVLDQLVVLHDGEGSVLAQEVEDGDDIARVVLPGTRAALRLHLDGLLKVLHEQPHRVVERHVAVFLRKSRYESPKKV